MRHVAVRVVALIAILGQLQQLPAAIACADAHAGPVAGDCGQPMPGNGPAIQAESTGMPAPLCALTSGCATQPPAMPGSAGIELAPGTGTDRAMLSFPAPVSFVSSPAPPPPQA